MKVNRQIIFVALSSLSGKKETNKNPDFDVSANLKYPNHYELKTHENLVK